MELHLLCLIVKLLIGAEKSPKTISLQLRQTNENISYKTEKAGINVAFIFLNRVQVQGQLHHTTLVYPTLSTRKGENKNKTVTHLGNHFVFTTIKTMVLFAVQLPMTAQYRWSCLRKQWHWSKWKSTSIKWQWKWNQQQQWSFSKNFIRSKTLNLSDVALAVEDWQWTACRPFLQSLYFSLLLFIIVYIPHRL